MNSRIIFLVNKAEIVSLKPEHRNEIHFLKRRISVDTFGRHVDLDQRCVKSFLDAMAMNHCKSLATPGSKRQEGQQCDGETGCKGTSRVPIRCWNLPRKWQNNASTLPSVRRKSWERQQGPTVASKTKLARIARYLKVRQRCVLNFLWVGKLDDVIHVTVDEDWAGDPQILFDWNISTLPGLQIHPWM